MELMKPRVMMVLGSVKITAVEVMMVVMLKVRVVLELVVTTG